jgi:membrane protein
MVKLLILLRQAFTHFQRNNPLRLAAATAFFTTFALPAILIILIQTLGLIFSRRVISRHLLDHLADIIGAGTVEELHATLRNVRHLATNWYIATGGFLFLVFVSTTLFAVIKDTLNQLWNIQLRKRSGILFLLRYRVQSFLIIMVTGLLFVLVLLAEAVQALLSEYLTEIWGHSNVILETGFNQILSLTVVSIWFSIIFRFLPDVRPGWRIAFTGGIFTGLLFTVGKLLLALLLSYNNMKNIYGASTSMALLLLFVFYSAFIFYYGACFTKVWADYVKKPIGGRGAEVGNRR